MKKSRVFLQQKIYPSTTFDEAQVKSSGQAVCPMLVVSVTGGTASVPLVFSTIQFEIINK